MLCVFSFLLFLGRCKMNMFEELTEFILLKESFKQFTIHENEFSDTQYSIFENKCSNNGIICYYNKYKDNVCITLSLP